MRSSKEIEQTIELHGDAVLRTCYTYFFEKQDAEDAFQDSFLKFATNDTLFKDEEHKKAWLIRVAANICKDKLKKKENKNVSFPKNFQQASSQLGPEKQLSDQEILEQALNSLDEDSRVALELFVVEDYTADEISKILDKPTNTIYSLVRRAKSKLKEVFGHE